MRSFFVTLLIVLAAPLPLHAQEYETSPIYQKADGIPSSALHRWNAHANGLSATIFLVPPPRIGPWSEGMVVDGPEGHQVIHWWIADHHSHVYFGYDLLLESVPGTQKIHCTVKPLTVSSVITPGGTFDPNLPSPSISEAAEPLLIEDGGTFKVGMFPESQHQYKFIEYVEVKASPKPPPQATN